MQPAAGPETRPEVRALRSLLEQELRVVLSDGRVLLGRLQCADKQGNLVLHNTREFLPSRRGRTRLSHSVVSAADTPIL